MKYDVIIIGKGPAGISSALYTIRANIKTLIIGTDNSVLKKAEKIDNYYGFPESIDGNYLLGQGVKQIEKLNGKIIIEEVVGIEKYETFQVKTNKGTYESDAVLLSTGQPVAKIKIKGLKELEGKGISYCTTCDGFFYRGKKVGVIGYKDFAVNEAEELKAFTQNVTIYTNGNEPEFTDKYKHIASEYNVCSKKITEITGQDRVEKLCFEDNSYEDIEGLFIAYDSATSINFAKKMGIIMNGVSIVVNNQQETNIEGLYAAGDITGGFKQVSIAVGQGAMAAKQIIEYVRKKKTR